MLSSRLVSTLSVLLVSGVAIAAIAPVLPFQEPVQPTKQHALVTKGAGSFEGTLTMWMPGSEEGMEAPCTEVVTAIGDLWTVSHFEMDFMGQAFQGSASLGYDPEKKKFVGTWIDGMTTSLTLMEGEWDEAKKAIVMDYESFDPMAGGMVAMRNENVITDSGYTTTFFKIVDGEAQKSMKIEMTRKKAVEAGTVK